LPGPANRGTLRHLLMHRAGLPAWKPFYRQANATPDSLWTAIYATPLDTLPDSRTVYSDIGFILLGEVVRAATGERLDAYLARAVFEPLAMRETGFLPPAQLLPRIAPTEVDPWRGRKVHGEVHDENAYALGGVSGHAGLFSTAADLTRFARLYLNAGRSGSEVVLDSSVIRLFTAPIEEGRVSRALGWDLASGNSSAGRALSSTAFGHTGFTGTSLWIDPAKDLFILLLSNRVNPSRENGRISAVRAALATAVGTLIEVANPPPPDSL
jgi:serine-type D-Ala-D-Ala carboxypeptidase